MKYLQRLGHSLMLPVSILPVAAILKGVGYWIDPIGWGTNNLLAAFLITSGGAILDNLPLLFAVAVAMGMTKEKEPIVAISAIVAYVVITTILSPEGIALLYNTSVELIPKAFESSNNTLIGIMSGLVVEYNYRRFSKMQLSDSLSFFAGKRFVPIISAIVMLAISFSMLYIWPALYDFFVFIGEIISGFGPFGAGLYGFCNRLLIPTGLHHALNSVFWFDVAGIDDFGKFWGTISGGIKGITGMYQAGFFPVMMFGLPAAALAMYQCATPQKKKQVGALLLSAAVASFLTGVTEPIEFAFMFVAPGLYFIHACLTGISLFIAASLQWIAGFSFSAGLIDYILSIKSPFATDILFLIPLGITYAIVYYVIFKLLILKFDLPTPGREKDMDLEEDNELSIAFKDQDYDETALQLLEALGGRKNIFSVDSCITRLRAEIRDVKEIEKEKLLFFGETNIVYIGSNNIQIVIGPEVQFIVDAMNDILL